MDLKNIGLKDSDIELQRKKYGTNKLPEPEPVTFWNEFKGNLNDPMLKLLIGVAIIMTIMFTFGQAEIYEPIGTFIAIVLVASIGAKTTIAAGKAYLALKNSVKKDTCKVYRNGVITVIEIDDIVVGDMVLLQSGDKIPADGILKDGNITVNNTSLNGETEECKKTKASSDYEMPLETKSEDITNKHCLFSGSVVYNGEGILEVKRVGIGNPETNYPGTIMGQMALEMNVEEPDSPLKVKLSKLASQISTFGYVGAVALGVAYMVHFILKAGGVSNYLNDFKVLNETQIGILIGGATVAFIVTCIITNFSKIKNKEKIECKPNLFKLPIIAFFSIALLIFIYFGSILIFKDLLHAFELAIVIIVCAVPEGLPLMISIVLMSNTGEMLKHNVLVRKAIGIETAGSINTLFSDKTGTITKGLLEVVEFFSGDSNTVDIKNNKTDIKKYFELSVCRNTGAMFNSEHKVIGGNATDKALLEFLDERTFNLYENEVVTEKQEFSSANKFSSAYIDSLHKTFYKGAPEKLIKNATKYLDSDGVVKELNKEILNKKLEELAKRAMRLLAFGYSEKKLVLNEVNEDIVLIGIVAIRDDLRPEAVQAIKEVQHAGIHVCMITGDKKETAYSIATDAGLLNTEEDIILTSDELNEKTDDEIKNIFTRIKVIARALPTDKSRMVRIGQSLNRVIGMTGDGTNDSPALKQADVGFAMGITGTDAAKEAADIIITDDNFKSIKESIKFGRTIYLNILKFCRFQLTINVAAVSISAILPFLGFEAPLQVTQMLFLNLVMDSLGALLLGKEPARESYMNHPPKQRNESLISKNIFIQFVTMGVFVTILSILYFKLPFFSTFFENEAQFRTGYFAFFIFISIFNGFNVRTDGFGIFKDLKKNKNFLKVWFAMLLAVVVLCMIGGPIGQMFGCTPFGLQGWILVTVMAVTIIPIDLLRKAIFKTYKNE